MSAPDPRPSAPAIDAEAIRTWCEVVLRGLEGFVPVRLLAEKGSVGARPETPFVPVSAAAVAIIRHAERAAGEGRGVFAVPGTVAAPGTARARDIQQSAVVVVDLDSGNVAGKLAHLEASLGLATLVVASGGRTEDGQAKLHGYWRLTHPVEGGDLQQLADLRGLIARRVGGDPSFASLHQPIRVAGTIHGKHGVLSPVRIVSRQAATLDLDAIEARAREMPAFPGIEIAIDAGSPRKAGPRASDLMNLRTRAGAVDGTSRFEAVGKVIGHWLHMVRADRITIEEARTRVQQFNAACISPPWDERQLADSFDRLLARDVEAHGPMPDLSDLLSAEGAADAGDRGQSSARPVPQPVPFSEDDLAQRFAERHVGQVRFAPARGCWMVWSGTHWTPDHQGRVRDRVRRSCRIAAATVMDARIATRLSSERTFTAVEKLARADPLLATPEQAWDAGPMQINTPGGVLDLQTGLLRPHAPGDLLTRIAGATPRGACPTWLRFLDDGAGAKEGLVAYLQRVAGYVLTGSMAEQVFFFLCGSGANGKSVFVSVLAHILGDYAATAALDTFTSGSGERHPTDLAGIAKARLVAVTETEPGKAWAEARIKAITGGDRLRVRFLYRDFFEIDPTFKILVAGNSRPRLSGVGEAMRRRLHLVPFDVTIAAERRDKTLLDRLRAEGDGIMLWALEGCRAWQEMGLAPPPCVLEAATGYFDDEDLVGQWLDEACETGQTAWSPSSHLFRSWKRWAEERGEEAGSQRSLGEELRTRGFKPRRTPKARGWSGIALRRPGSGGEAG